MKVPTGSIVFCYCNRFVRLYAAEVVIINVIKGST
jgi:hypothetical protein